MGSATKFSWQFIFTLLFATVGYCKLKHWYCNEISQMSKCWIKVFLNNDRSCVIFWSLRWIFTWTKIFNKYCYSFHFPLACNSLCYNVLPSSDIICANIGDSFDIIVEHSELVSFDLYKESNDVFDIAVCNDSDICVIHNDIAHFEIKSFQPCLAGSYQYRYSFAVGNSSFCATPFTIGELSYIPVHCKNGIVKIANVLVSIVARI